MKFRAPSDGNILELLQQRFPDASRSTLRQWLRLGRVTLDGATIIRADTPLQAGALIEILSRRKNEPQPPGQILFRDEYVLAIEKPPGLLSVKRDRPGEDTLLRRLNDYVAAMSHGRERVFIVHRLDARVSGVMLFAFSREIRERLKSDWQTTDKRYWALVEGHPPEAHGTMRSWLREDRSLRVRSVPQSPEAKFAITHYRVRHSSDAYALLEVRIETGRKNQIRAHLSELGCPIAGDRKYGAKTDPIGRLALHAFRLDFTHPVTRKRIRIELPLPPAFRIP